MQVIKDKLRYNNIFKSFLSVYQFKSDSAKQKVVRRAPPRGARRDFYRQGGKQGEEMN